jgi:hypothetical protein
MIVPSTWNQFVRANTLMVALVIVAGCRTADVSGPQASAPALLSVGSKLATSQAIRGPGSALCVTSPTVVVTTEPALTAAVAASHTGDVIAIDGTIVLEHDIEVRSAGVTITCTQPGDGLVASPASPGVYALLDIYAPDVTVQGLSMDARNAGDAIYAEATPGFNDGRRVRISGNDIQCGLGDCMFIIGPGARITNNTLTSESGTPGSGIHMQSTIDSALVEGNQVIALGPRGASVFGAIRAVRGKDVVIRNNVITGPWSNGLALTMLAGGVVEGNSISGARLNGIYAAYGNYHTVSMLGVRFQGNTSTAEGPALFVDGACGNVFVANRLATTGSGPVAAFDLNTGANALLGPHGDVVDNGNVDCDGDGTSDPNMISGAKRKGTIPPGEVIGPVMRSLRGIVIQ